MITYLRYLIGPMVHFNVYSLICPSEGIPADGVKFRGQQSTRFGSPDKLHVEQAFFRLAIQTESCLVRI